ncbi:peptidoglycan bridge formation glycyltransferase FemA/FemB family protein [Candidatus Woesebacteria bacterium]|nr:peptidoglycan bridge formation glycyltransferase FemA/FemB family protein [Candidatus Woesebacteria bacterium]
MSIKLINSETEWNNFFDRVGSPSFHHAWEWGTFQEKHGYPIERLGVYHKNDLIGICLVVKIRSKRGNFLLIPHGPLFETLKLDQLGFVIEPNKYESIKNIFFELNEHLKSIARNEGYWFIRMASPLLDNKINRQLFHDLGFRKSSTYIHAETMHVIDLRKSTDELLSKMRKNTRYYVRKAIKESLEIECRTDDRAMDIFWELLAITVKRERFVSYSKKYIDNEYRVFRKNNNAVFFLGKAPPKFAEIGPSNYLAGSLVIFTKTAGFYHHGASIHTKIPIAYKLQWDSILYAKNRGCHFYNLHGVYRPGRAPRAWKGLTLFKQGFGGSQMDYVPTQDYAVSPKYIISFAADQYINLKRGM